MVYFHWARCCCSSFLFLTSVGDAKKGLVKLFKINTELNTKINYKTFYITTTTTTATTTTIDNNSKNNNNNGTNSNNNKHWRNVVVHRKKYLPNLHFKLKMQQKLMDFTSVQMPILQILIGTNKNKNKKNINNNNNKSYWIGTSPKLKL